ncbi:Uncharacterised protein [Burkholderia pseudomallei]|nr:Uncharacterised protein [Burkholderia pseudomallei]CAJ6110498.1 Uncharacterised protein [Burkholderia pseudomallei]VCL21174.1 Uncharacterised protein [Burkholderia pseudomallei]VCL21918.1 Uncharacterised protein [Burkholderia pseudomallei]
MTFLCERFTLSRQSSASPQRYRYRHSGDGMWREELFPNGG